jgi:F-type H+-transporting ATPase subunit epsilon
MAQDKLIEIEIVTPQSKVFSGKAQSVTVPGVQSPFQILFNHAPIVSTLELGMVKIADENNKTILFATSEGFAEVQRNHISILVESALDAADLNIDDINKMISDENTKIDESESTDEIDTAKKRVMIAENQLKAAEKYRQYT